MRTEVQLLLLVLAQLSGAASLRLEGPQSGSAAAKSATTYPLATSPFKNTLLVVHCRLKDHGLDPTTTCEERRPLYQGYKKYFGDVLYITPSDCPKHPGDPQSCMAKIIMGPGANRDGVFYLHFDAFIKPRNLGQIFNETNMYCFDWSHWCEINRETLDQEHCNRRSWSPRQAQQFQESIETLRSSGVARFKNLDPWTFWMGNDDMFYVPKSVYDLYIEMAPAFSGNHHEIAGPSMRGILQRLTRVPVKSLRCSGICCKTQGSDVDLRTNFMCGRSFDPRKGTEQDAPPDVRAFADEEEVDSYMPLETWKRMLEQALE